MEECVGREGQANRVGTGLDGDVKPSSGERLELGAAGAVVRVGYIGRATGMDRPSSGGAG